MNPYKTISGLTEGSYKEKGSKFLSFAYPVNSLDEVEDHLATLKKKYHDARHHCYAYMLGMGEQEYRANDDGEPNHSAGDPILGQIRSFELTNVLIVVVRYFGGTKLGVGGLISAYKQGAADALSKAKIVCIYPQTSFDLIFPYSLTSEVERVLNEFEIEYTNKEFTETCQYTGKISDAVIDRFIKRVKSIQGIRLDMHS